MLSEQLEQIENFDYNCAGAAIDVCLAFLAAALNLRKVYQDKLWTTKTSDRYLLMGWRLPPQIGHNKVDQNRVGNVAYLLLVSGALVKTTWLCPGNHINCYTLGVRRKNR